MASAITALQYIRGGDRYSKVFTQIDLYRETRQGGGHDRAAVLSDVRCATNASGEMGAAQNYLNVRGKTFVPAWATAATGSVLASSWMMDPDVVGVWVSTPQRLDPCSGASRGWTSASRGYKALAITDFTRTRELISTTRCNGECPRSAASQMRRVLALGPISRAKLDTTLLLSVEEIRCRRRKTISPQTVTGCRRRTRTCAGSWPPRARPGPPGKAPPAQHRFQLSEGDRQELEIRGVVNIGGRLWDP